MSAFKDKFDNPQYRPSADEMNCILLAAHLSSAGIRVGTLKDLLKLETGESLDIRDMYMMGGSIRHPEAEFKNQTALHDRMSARDLFAAFERKWLHAKKQIAAYVSC